MLRYKEYKELAERINELMKWKTFGFEMLSFYFVALVAPPVASYLMVCSQFNFLHFCTYLVIYCSVISHLFNVEYTCTFTRKCSAVVVDSCS